MEISTGTHFVSAFKYEQLGLYLFCICISLQSCQNLRSK